MIIGGLNLIIWALYKYRDLWMITDISQNVAKVRGILKWRKLFVPGFDMEEDKEQELVSGIYELRDIPGCLSARK